MSTHTATIFQHFLVGILFQSLNTTNSGDSIFVEPYIGPNATWCGEFAGYDANSMSTQGGFYNGDGSTPGFAFYTNQTPAVVPPAKNSLVITAIVGNDTVPYQPSAGFSEVYSYLTSTQSIEVQVKNAGTPDATTPVSNTFQGGDGNPKVSGIVMFAPNGSAQPAARTRHAANRATDPTNTRELWNQRKK